MGCQKYREGKNKMRKNVKKYIPLDEDFMKRSMSDLLFAYIQINSYKDKNGIWFCYKPRDFFSKAKESLGIKSVNTIKNKYENLLDGNYIQEGEVVGLSGEVINAIIIPVKTNYFEKVDIKILELLAHTTKENTVKIYSYLLNKNRIYKGEYIFTYKELIQNCLGNKNGGHQNSLKEVKLVLELLVRLKLIEFKTVRQKETFRQKLISVATKLPELQQKI